MAALSHGAPAAAATPNDRPPNAVRPSDRGGCHVITDTGDVVSKRNLPLPDAEADAAARNAAVRRVPAAEPASQDATTRAAELAELGAARA